MEVIKGLTDFFLSMLPLVLGFGYGYVSSKGQFCMNSGFSNVIRKKDTTKLKSFVTAILIQMIVLPLAFVVIYKNASDTSFIHNISLPPLFVLASAAGGFIFGICMYYTAGCGAGIFYKIGEKNTGALFASAGFILGIFLAQQWLLSPLKQATQDVILISQKPIWKGDSAWTISILITIVASASLYFLFRSKDKAPGGALWGWQKTGVLIGLIGLASWASAILSQSPFGMSIIPGVMDIIDLRLSWALWFLIGIPIGSYWSNRKNDKRQLSLPNYSVIGKRTMGGIGLGVSGSIAAGCTVGHGLTFFPLLGIGSIVATIFIFLGSGLVGYLTRP